MEALEENFETHQEKINLLVSGHTKLDCDEEEVEDEEEARDDVMETDKPEDNPEDEDPSNLERAWEMLELAKTIYSRMAGTPTASSGQLEDIKKHCDTLL